MERSEFDLIDNGVDWVRNHPTKAALAGAVGGFLIGLTGVRRIVTGVRVARSIPYVSQIAFGLVMQGLAARRLGKSSDPSH